MSQTLIYLGQTGQDALTTINSNFSQLFGVLPAPIKFTATGNTSQGINANTLITAISVTVLSGSPSLNIGTTFGGGDVLPTTAITQFTLITYQQYFASPATLYFNVSGVGGVNIRIDYIANYF